MTHNCPRALFLASILVSTLTPCFSQTSENLTPDLHKLVKGNEIEVVNRSLSLIQDGSHIGIRLDEKENDGLALFKNIQFSNGTIEFDVKGKDVQGQSFVGLAFHGQDKNTYDAIYLRPFNFKSEDKVKSSHCVQYISQPVYTWNKLRAEFPGKYEQGIEPSPDPNSWVHMKVVVASPKISVYINRNNQPSLEVNKLSQRTTGWLSFFVGNGSGGDFSGLKIIPSR
jgi:hypothetical protein